MNKLLDKTIKGYPVRIWVRAAAIGNVLGAAAAFSVSCCKKDGSAAKKYARYSLGAGVVAGLTMGGFQPLFLVSCASFTFFSVRGLLSRVKIVLPGKEDPVQGEFLTSLSGGFTLAGCGVLKGWRFFHCFSYGLVLGFVGHWVYEKARIARLEYILKATYPELVAQLKDAEDYTYHQEMTNQFYRGPVTSRPWINWELNKPVGGEDDGEDKKERSVKQKLA